MSERLNIPPNEHGLLRVFALDSQLEMEIEHAGTLDGLIKALGISALNQDAVQLVKIDSVADLGLTTFLEMAYDITPDDLKENRTTLDALTGQIAIIRAGAITDTNVIIDGAAKLVATLHEGQTERANLSKLTAKSAEGILDKPVRTKKPKSDARVGGMIATYALIFMFALVGLMIWIAS